MSEVSALSDAEKAFLEPYLPASTYRRRDAETQVAEEREDGHRVKDRNQTGGGDLPFVTLTYACSLDSMISLAPGLRTNLSGPETKSMTHYLRMHHDAILVGVGTAIPDNPGLNSRYPGATLDSQPRPVVVDPQMRWNVYDSKLAQLAQDGQGKPPWLIHVPRNVGDEDLVWWGGKRIFIPGDASSTAQEPKPGDRNIMDWPTILRTLKRDGIDSIMIEGGATVISTLLSMPELVNSVIVTIAPTWLGQGGVAVTPAAKTSACGRVNAARLQETSWRQFGADAVLCGNLQA